MVNFIKSIPFHIRSAGKSLVRHFVMTLSASSAVMVTLILLAAFLLLVGNVSGFANNIEDDIRIHAVLTSDVESEEQIADARTQLEAIPGVKTLEFSDKDNELKMWIAEKGEVFSVYEGEQNPLSNAFFISVDNAEQIESITQQMLALDIVDNAQYGGTSISQLVDLLNTIRTGIVFFVALLGLLALFLISNTIKMAIYARSNEIAIMRNVGATNTFIKTPFMMEGMMIGLFGSIIPCILTYFGYQYLYESLGGQMFTSVFALQSVSPFVFEIMGILVASGMIVGLLGSLISTTKYLHWKR